MMSVNELYYGNEPAPTWGVSTSAAQVKHYDSSYYGNYALYYQDSSSRHDQDTYTSPADSHNYYNPSLDSYTSRYQDSQQSAAGSRNNPRNNPTSYYPSSSTQYENSFGPMSRDRPQHYRDYSSNYNYYTSGGHSKGAATWVELRVPICCEACEERVSSRLLQLRGVESVKCDQLQQRVVVRGSSAPADVLKACKKLFKRSEFWRH